MSLPDTISEISRPFGLKANLLGSPMCVFYIHSIDWSPRRVHTELQKAAMFKFYSTFAFRNDLRIISLVDGNDFVGVQGWEGLFSCHHVVRITKVYEESSRLRNIFHEGVSSFGLDVSIMIFSLPCTSKKIDVILLKEKSNSIKLLLHAGYFRVKSFCNTPVLTLFALKGTWCILCN